MQVVKAPRFSAPAMDPTIRTMSQITKVSLCIRYLLHQKHSQSNIGQLLPSMLQTRWDILASLLDAKPSLRTTLLLHLQKCRQALVISMGLARLKPPLERPLLSVPIRASDVCVAIQRAGSDFFTTTFVHYPVVMELLSRLG
jgi:hypothetical protein